MAKLFRKSDVKWDVEADPAGGAGVVAVARVKLFRGLATLEARSMGVWDIEPDDDVTQETYGEQEVRELISVLEDAGLA